MDIQIDVSNVKIDTPRLLLRPWRKTDLNDLYEYASVDGVGEMAGWKHHKSIANTRDTLHAFMTDKNVFALQLKSNAKVVGSLGLHNSWANCDTKYANFKIKEIGYVLSKDYWGQGLMPEAVNAILNYCFNVLGLDALTVTHFIDNSQSKRVIEKNGFTFVTQSEFASKTLNKTFLENRYILFRK
ncbi:MAG: GNAT family N-acetyltransferase [Clostridia bacterium]|nr:GNAT family N-acetyltransferase [Clostridia bacterium]